MYILSFPGLVSLTQRVKAVTLLPRRHDVGWIWNLVSLVNCGPRNFTVLKRWKNNRLAGACSCLCSMVFCRGSRTRHHCNVLLLRQRALLIGPDLKCSISIVPSMLSKHWNHFWFCFVLFFYFLASCSVWCLSNLPKADKSFKILLVRLWEVRRFINKYDYQRLVVPSMILMITGSLSTDVFKQRLSTKNGRFTPFSSGFVQILRRIVSIEVN